MNDDGEVFNATVDLLVVVIPALIGAGVAIYVAHLSRRNEARMDTGNEKPLGATVHDIAEAVDALSAQTQANTAELNETRRRLEGLIDELT